MGCGGKKIKRKGQKVSRESWWVVAGGDTYTGHSIFPFCFFIFLFLPKNKSMIFFFLPSPFSCVYPPRRKLESEISTTTMCHFFCLNLSKHRYQISFTRAVNAGLESNLRLFL